MGRLAYVFLPHVGGRTHEPGAVFRTPCSYTSEDPDRLTREAQREADDWQRLSGPGEDRAVGDPWGAVWSVDLVEEGTGARVELVALWALVRVRETRLPDPDDAGTPDP